MDYTHTKQMKFAAKYGVKSGFILTAFAVLCGMALLISACTLNSSMNQNTTSRNSAQSGNESYRYQNSTGAISRYYGAIFVIETSGGFIAPPFAMSTFGVSNMTETLTVYSQNGSVMSRTVASTSSAAYSLLASAFENASFLDLNSTYKGDHIIPDVGVTKITMDYGNGTYKDVIIYSGVNIPTGLLDVMSIMDSMKRGVAQIDSSSGIGEQALVLYVPVQCTQTPWEEWMANSSIRFVKAPTQAEMISLYYGDVFNITLHNVTQVDLPSDVAVCMACGICSRSYSIRAYADKVDLDMLNGWNVVSMS